MILSDINKRKTFKDSCVVRKRKINAIFAQLKQVV